MNEDGYYPTVAEAAAWANGFKSGSKAMIEKYGMLAFLSIQDAVRGEYDGLDKEAMLSKFWPSWVRLCGAIYNDYANNEREVIKFSDVLDGAVISAH